MFQISVTLVVLLIMLNDICPLRLTEYLDNFICVDFITPGLYELNPIFQWLAPLVVTY